MTSLPFLSRWLVLLALLMLAFGPAVAPVLSGTTQARGIEICTAFGLMRVAVEGDFAPPAEKDHRDHKASSGHCALCQVRKFLALGIVPSSPALPVRIAVVFAWPEPPVTADEPRRITASYRSRAPPARPA